MLHEYVMDIKNQDWPNLKMCRDYPILQKSFTIKEMDLYERQLTEYIEMDEITDTYLSDVPRIVCWYEGLINTEMLLMEMKDYVFL